MIKTVVTEDNVQSDALTDEMLPPVIPPEEPSNEQTLNLNTDELLEVVAEVLSTFKCKTPEGRELFKTRYLSINRLVLSLIGFDKALRKLPAMALKPEYAVLAGAAVMVTTALFIKVDESQFISKSQSKGTEKTKSISEKETKTDVFKDIGMTPEEVQKFVEIAEDTNNRGDGK